MGANQRGNTIHRWAAAAALAGLSLGAQAETANKDAFDKFLARATGSTKQTISFGTGGVPIATAGVPGAAQVGGIGVAHAPGGWPAATGMAQVPSPVPGKTLPVKVTQPLTNASVAGALGRFSARALPFVGTGLAVIALMDELGLAKMPDDGSGKNTWGAVTDDSACAHYTKPANFTACGDMTATSDPPYWVVKTESNKNYCYARDHCTSGGQIAYTYDVYAGEANMNVAATPLTTQEIADRIAAKSGWPSSSNIAPALAEAVRNGETVDYVAPIFLEVPTPKVTGSPKVTTSSDGTTKTETVECDSIVPLGGSTIEYRCSTKTTTTTPEKTTLETVTVQKADGTTTTETVTRTTPATSETVTVDHGEDTAPTESDKDNLDVPTDAIPKTTKTITFDPEDLGFGSGQCPSPITWSDSLGTHEIPFDQICGVLDSVIRPLVIAMAILAALFIVAPVRTEG